MVRFSEFLNGREPDETLLRQYLSSRGEWITREFKRADQPSVFGLRIAVAAFGNSAGGDVFLGVDDSGTPVGTPVQPVEISRALRQEGATPPDHCITDLVLVAKEPRRIQLAGGLPVYWIDIAAQGLLVGVLKSDGTLGVYDRSSWGWYEECSPGCAAAVTNTNFDPAAGDSVTVQVATSSGSSTLQLTDSTNGLSWNHAISLTPSTNTVEWAVESPASALFGDFVLPDFTSVTFSNPIVQESCNGFFCPNPVSSFQLPLLSQSVVYIWTCQVPTKSCLTTLDQYLLPSLLSSNDESFTVTYTPVPAT